MFDNRIAPYFTDGRALAAPSARGLTTQTDGDRATDRRCRRTPSAPAAAGDPAPLRRPDERPRALHGRAHRPRAGHRARRRPERRAQPRAPRGRGGHRRGGCGPRRGPRRRCRSRARCRSGRTSTRSPPATGGAGRRSPRCTCGCALEGSGPRRRLPQQGRRRAGSTSAGSVLGTRGVHEVDVELDLRPFEDGGWYWFDLTTDDDELTLHDGGWYARSEAPGRRRGDDRHADVQPPRRLRRHPHRDRRGPAGARRRHRVILPDQGTKKVRDEPGFEAAAAALGDRLRIIDQPNLGGSGGYARVMYEALGHAGVRADPVHGRRHPARARLGAARRRVLPVRPASRCSSAGRCCRCRPARSSRRWARSSTATPSCGATPRSTEPHHDLAERTLRQTAVAAPAGRRRLQRLVDVPDPARGRRGPRAAAAAVHQVGRRRVRPARPRARLPHGDGAGDRDLAHVVPGEGRHQRLAGLLPLPQPPRRGRAARPGRPAGRCSPTRSSAPCGT